MTGSTDLSGAFDRGQPSWRATAKKFALIYVCYLLACAAFEITERRVYHVQPLRQVRAIGDPVQRKAEETTRQRSVDAMMESPAYLIYLFGTFAGSIAVFIGGLFWMRRWLRPMLANPAAAHFIYMPLLFFPSLACLAVLAPPWALPFVIDGRSWAEFVKELHST